MNDNVIIRTQSAYGYPLLIKNLLHPVLQHYGKQEIVYKDKFRYTYRDFGQRLSKLANAMKGIGVGYGTTVAVMDWDSHRYLECFFAIPMVGAVLVNINVRLNPEQILYTLNHSKANILLIHAEFLPVLESIADRIESIRHFILIEDFTVLPQTSIPFAGEYEELVAEASGVFEFPDFDEDTRATTFYTTGTTGDPKGVYFSHRQLVLHTLAMAVAISAQQDGQRMHRNDVYMPITPMFHVHAWGVPYVATMLGIKQVYPGRYLPDVLLRLKVEEKVTFSHCVPSILQMLLSTASAQNIDLSGWKIVIGGSSLSPKLARSAMERGIDIWSGYGMSETAPLLAMSQFKSNLSPSTLEEDVAIRSKTGIAAPLVDLRVVDSSMREVPHDGKTVGEVVVRAPWLTQGYLHNAKASEELWQGGYLHTQDLAVIDDEGYVQISDRTKDVIKSGGEWISSIELENLVSQCTGVAEAAVIGMSDDKWGERPLALVVANAGADTAELQRSIKSHLLELVASGHLSKFAVPERIYFVPQIEKTSVGKVNKKQLRSLYL